MKWFKPMFLTGAMALVTWGVWHTLTQHKHAGPGETEEPSAKWAREAPKHGKSDGGAGRNDSGRYDSTPPGSSPPGANPEVSLAGDPFTQNRSSPGGGAKLGTLDPGPPLPGAKEGVRDNLAPRVGGQTPGGPSQPKEDPSAVAANVESQRLADQFDALLKRVKEMKAKGQLVPAYEELSSWYPRQDKLSLANTLLMFKELDELAGEVLYSQRSYLSKPYAVTNESLAVIARPVSVTPELLGKINGIERPDQISGRNLKMVHGPFHAELRRSKFELTILVGDKRLYAGRFPVGIGPEGAQPGTYKVIQKQMDPVYYPDPANRAVTVPGRDPRNALGSRLIVFKSADGDGAFHGTIEPQSIGKACKDGGIRLKPKDIEDIYDMLIENESQLIVRE